MAHQYSTNYVQLHRDALTIRLSAETDLPMMQAIFAEAKAKMRKAGNLTQWTGGYPSDDILLQDMRRGFSYIVERDGVPVATFVLAECEDPTYRVIYDGAWLDDILPYGTIHRIASIEGVHGIVDAVIAWSLKRVRSLRVDTHRDNLPMQHILAKNGFSYCGIIYLLDGSPRLAYQKLACP